MLHFYPESWCFHKLQQKSHSSKAIQPPPYTLGKSKVLCLANFIITTNSKFKYNIKPSSPLVKEDALTSIQTQITMVSLQVLIRPWMRKRKWILHSWNVMKCLILKNLIHKLKLYFLFLEMQLTFSEQQWWLFVKNGHFSKLLMIFRFSRLLEGDKDIWRVGQLLGFHVFLYLPVEKMELWEDPEQHELLWEETQGSGSQLNSIELISFASVYSKAGRHIQLGKVAQLTHRCHVNI